MRRSKIFLGATATILAIAGVFATKRYTGGRIAYYITQAGQVCALQIAVPCTRLGTFICKYETLGPGFNNILVFTGGPGLAPFSPNVCQNKVFYNGGAD